MKRIVTGVLVAVLALLSACGYGLVGTGNFLPPDARTVRVETFINETTRVELEQRVTQAVAEEMVSRSRLRLVSSDAEADLLMRGTIRSFNISPIAFNEQVRATQYQVTVTAKIELLDRRRENAPIWTNDAYMFNENYSIDVAGVDAFDQETRAIEEIAERFAQSLVATLLEGF